MQNDQEILKTFEKLSKNFDKIRDGQINFQSIITKSIQDINPNLSEILKTLPTVLELSDQLINANHMDNVLKIFNTLKIENYNSLLFKVIVLLSNSVSRGSSKCLPWDKRILDTVKKNRVSFTKCFNNTYKLNLTYWWHIICQPEINDQCREDFLNDLLKMPENCFDNFPLTAETLEPTILFLSEYPLKDNLHFYDILITPSFDLNFRSSTTSTGVAPEGPLASVLLWGSYSSEIRQNIISLLTNYFKTSDNENFEKNKPMLFDVLFNPLFDPDPKVWVKASIRIRKLLKLMNKDPNFKDKIPIVIENMKTHFSNYISDSPQWTAIMLSHACDVKSSDILSSLAISDNNIIECYIKQLSVLFSPHFLQIDPEKLSSISTTCRKRNQRLKLQTKDTIFIDHSSDIVDSPIYFEMTVFEEEPIPYFLHIHLPKKSFYKTDQPISEKNSELIKSELEFLESIILKYPEYFTTMLTILSYIQKNIIHYIPSIHSTFLAETFFHKCLSEQFNSMNFKNALTIVTSLPKDFQVQDSDMKRWIEFIRTGITKLNDDNSMLPLIKESFFDSLSRFVPESYSLIPDFLEKISTFSEITDTSILLSIHVILLETNPQNKEQIEAFKKSQSIFYSKFRDLIFSKPENFFTEYVLGPLISLLFIDLIQDGPIDQRLQEIFECFFASDINGNLPETLRALSLFPLHYNEIHSKMPTFFSKYRKFVFSLLFSNNTSPLLFKFLIFSLVDLSVQEKSNFLEDSLRIKQNIQDNSKKAVVDIAKDQFLSFQNKEITEVYPFGENINTYVISHRNSLNAISYSASSPNSFLLTSKTVSGASQFNISLNPSFSESHPVSSTDNPNSYIKSTDVDEEIEIPCFGKDFEQSIDHYIDEKILTKDNIQNNFQLNHIAPGISSYSSGQQNLQETQISAKEMKDRLSNLYPSPAATAFFLNMTNGSEDQLTVYKPTQLITSAATNLFGCGVRESLKIGVLYVKKGQNGQNEILRNQWSEISPAFKSFCASIGNFVDLAEHTGFNGKLDVNFSNGRYQLYFSNNRYEVMFHVAPILPTDKKDEQQLYKKRHIGNDNIHIVWSEHSYDYDPMTITSQFNDAHVIIYPIQNCNLFRVVVKKKNPEYHFGPLVEETILSAKVLPNLVRWTAIFADRVAREATSTYKLPFELFQQFLSDLLEMKTEESV